MAVGQYDDAVFGALALLFLVGSVVELAVLVKVGEAIGVLNTIGLLILSSVVGSWLLKREGLGVIRRMQTTIAAGRVPGKEMADALLIVVGGALMIAPGFITDIVGMLLLVPPVRVVVRRLLRRRIAARVIGSSDIIDL